MMIMLRAAASADAALMATPPDGKLPPNGTRQNGRTFEEAMLLTTSRGPAPRKAGQRLQRARPDRCTEQCSEGVLDVLQALAVCEVRVRAVRTYDLVRPDGKGFRAAVG